jgi:hypothetical protein
MTPERCQRATQIDMVAFLEEPQGAVWEEFRQHAQQCADCHTAIAQWTQLDTLLQAFGKEGPVTHPAAEQLAAYEYSPQRLSAEARDTLDQHLRSCSSCAEEFAAVRSLDFSRLQREGVESVMITPPKPALARFVIQRVKDGLDFVVEQLAAPIAAVQEILLLQPAARSINYHGEDEGGKGITLAKRLEVQTDTQKLFLEIILAEIPGRRVLRLTFLDSTEQGLAGHEVELYRDDRLVYAADTDPEGKFEVSGLTLEGGAYEITCPSLGTRFALELPALAG